MEEFGLGATALSTMTLAMLTLEFGKLIVRRLILKNPTYDFPSWVYVVFPPVLNTLWVVPLAYLGFQGFAVPASWADWGRNVLFVLITSLGTMAEILVYYLLVSAPHGARAEAKTAATQ